MPHDVLPLQRESGCTLQVHRWLPDQPPRAVILLSHGMADHAGRYGHLGEALMRAGMAMYGHDQRGHGLSASPDQRGLFAAHDGWAKVVSDIDALGVLALQAHPGTPLFLLGHSMGSYVAQAYLMTVGVPLQGAILSGSNFQPSGLYRVARLIAVVERLRQGPRGRSRLIEWLSFGTFNNAFKPTRTAFDWLSRDEHQVDRYIADPLCGFRCTNQLWLDLLGGLQHISQPRNLARIDADLPLLIIGGQCDPVSAGKRLKHLADALRGSGKRNVQLNLYTAARHELFNEINRDQVVADLIAWLDTQ